LFTAITREAPRAITPRPTLAARYSDDGGRSWTDEDVVVVENEGGMNVMSVSLLRLQNGDIAFFYLREELNRGLHTDAAYLQR